LILLLQIDFDLDNVLNALKNTTGNDQSPTDLLKLFNWIMSQNQNVLVIK